MFSEIHEICAPVSISALVCDLLTLILMKLLFEREVIVEMDGTSAIWSDCGPSRFFFLFRIGSVSYLYLGKFPLPEFIADLHTLER